MNRSRAFVLPLLVLATGIVFAQDAPPPAPPPAPAAPQAADEFGQPLGQQQPPPVAVPQTPPPAGIPAEVTLRPGTHFTVRVNQEMSSSRNQPGDTFSATLTQPIVVDGVVLAQRGQTVFGQVTDAEKSRGGRRARLALAITGLTFADGSQESLRTQEVLQEGPRTPVDQQVGTVANTTLVGAVVGNAISWRSGGAIGAAIGAGAGLATIAATRNRPSVVYPESVLTFQVESPVTVATGRAPGAFRYANSSDFEGGAEPPRLQRRDQGRRCWGCGPVPVSIGVGIGWGRGRWGGPYGTYGPYGRYGPWW